MTKPMMVLTVPLMHSVTPFLLPAIRPMRAMRPTSTAGSDSVKHQKIENSMVSSKRGSWRLTSRPDSRKGLKCAQLAQGDGVSFFFHGGLEVDHVVHDTSRPLTPC